MNVTFPIEISIIYAFPDPHPTKFTNSYKIVPV